MFNLDSYTIDSTGAFLAGELEVIDQKLHLPLTSVTWQRDIDVRSDITIADAMSSFTNSSFATSNPGKSWIGRQANAISAVDVDIQKTAQTLELWGKSVQWTIPELESAMKLGRPVDTQKVAALQLAWNIDIDNLVYLGDAALGFNGLANHSAITPTNAVTGNWATATASQILDDIREQEEATYAAAGYAFAPSELRLDPVSFGYLLRPLTIGTVSFNSILEYVSVNSLCNQINGVPLNIKPVKWLGTAGVSGTKRAVMYTKSEEYVRIPLTPLQRTPLEYRQLHQITTYYSNVGGVELPYPSTVSYRDAL